MNKLKKYVPQRIRNIFHLYKHKKQKRQSLKFVIDLTKHCNLNCRGCDHFSCISDEKYTDYNTVEKDLHRVKEVFGNRVEQIALLGGEPLLNDRIGDFCILARSIFPNTKIIIITNGTLIFKMSDEFWKVCKDNKIIIRITRYPINFDYDEAERHVKNQHVEIEYMAESDRVVKTMYCLPIDLEGKQDPKKSFKMCGKGNGCITLENGKLFTCTLIPNIEIFNKYFGKNVQVTEEDYIDIYRYDDPDIILDRLAKPFPFCRYCDTYNFRSDIPWATTNASIDEWT